MILDKIKISSAGGSVQIIDEHSGAMFVFKKYR